MKKYILAFVFFVILMATAFFARQEVILTASKRAAADWFRLGPLYLLSIIVYFGLISLLVTALITKWGLKNNKKI